MTFNKNVFQYPYSKCELVPKKGNYVIDAYPDKELGGNGLEYVLEDGKKDSILLDQVLDYNKDPAYIKKARLYNLTVEAIKVFEKKNISKSELCRRMGISRIQLNRLLDTTCYSKSTDKMLELLNALDYKVEFTFIPKLKFGL